MPSLDIVVSSKGDLSPRCKQISAMFDVPLQDVLSETIHVDAPIEDHEWDIGAIVGPSGSGKSTAARELFPGKQYIHKWDNQSLISSFGSEISIQTISNALMAVGLGNCRAWLRPYHTLSNGEMFRADMARALLFQDDLVVVDEFTSVVDRQVAKICSHAVQKFARKEKKRFVAVSCHYDILEWLAPSWVLDMADGSFARGSAWRRPPINITIARAGYDWWKVFSKFHYLTAELNNSAACFVLFVDDKPASFAGMLHHVGTGARTNPIKKCSRLVTLPDYQGLGLAMVLVDFLGAAYKSTGTRMRTYPAHPGLVKVFQRSTNWKQTKEYGTFGHIWHGSGKNFTAKGRPCATFEYCGISQRKDIALKMLER